MIYARGFTSELRQRQRKSGTAVAANSVQYEVDEATGPVGDGRMHAFCLASTSKMFDFLGLC